MTYFKIGDVDFSPYVSGLKIDKTAIYNTQTNASGNSIVDYINSKRVITVSIIPLDELAMMRLQLSLNAFSVNISFLNPTTNTLEENVGCIVPSDSVEYYTIRADKTLFNAYQVSFVEL